VQLYKHLAVGLVFLWDLEVVEGILKYESKIRGTSWP
jgi:hypothetical protein